MPPVSFFLLVKSTGISKEVHPNLFHSLILFASTSRIITVFAEAVPVRSVGSKKAICHSDSHLSPSLSLSQSVSLLHCHNLSAIKLAALSYPETCAKGISSWAIIATN